MKRSAETNEGIEEGAVSEAVGGERRRGEALGEGRRRSRGLAVV